MLRALTAAAVALALLLAACGEDETTTVINQTTTVTEDEPDDSTTETTTDDDDDDEADDDDSGPTEALKSFQSPTGNIGCAMTADFVRCDIVEKDWEAQRPEGCPGDSDFGQGLTLSATGQAEVVCAGDTVLDQGAPVLDYGSRSQIGPITCESDEEGVECSNESGGSFSLSREEYDLD
jgi:hypothetical protein